MTASTLFWILIGISIFDFCFERILEILNDKNSSDKLPEEAKGIYDEEKYAKSRAYDKETGRFGWLTSLFSFTLLMGMLFFDGFAWVDDYLRQNVTEHPILLTLLFFGILGFASDILSLPFSLYSIFVIEEKFGFNKTTIKTFVMDKIKGWLIGGLISSLLISAIVWFYQTTGTNFWIYAWILATVFMLFMTMFYTSWILPLFNKLNPLEKGDLRTAIENYCQKVGFQLTNLFEIDGSKRSTKANAFFSGLGPKKKIVLYDTLIEKLDNDEIVAVLAHEVGHYKKKHTRSSILLGILQTGITLFILSLLIDNPLLYDALNANHDSFHIGLIVFGFLYSPISTITGVFMNILSRKNEYEADNYAKNTSDANALQRALKKLAVDSLSNLTPHPFYVFVHYSHPPLLNRLENLNK